MSYWMIQVMLRPHSVLQDGASNGKTTLCLIAYRLIMKIRHEQVGKWIKIFPNYVLSD